MSKPNKEDTLEISQAQEAILSGLRFRERFGLEIMEAIEKSGGRQIGFSSLYPNLKKLEERGFVTSRWGDEPPEEYTGARRKYYKITASGIKALNHRQKFLEAVAHWLPGEVGV